MDLNCVPWHEQSDGRTRYVYNIHAVTFQGKGLPSTHVLVRQVFRHQSLHANLAMLLLT